MEPGTFPPAFARMSSSESRLQAVRRNAFRLPVSEPGFRTALRVNAWDEPSKDGTLNFPNGNRGWVRSPDFRRFDGMPSGFRFQNPGSAHPQAGISSDRSGSLLPPEEARIFSVGSKTFCSTDFPSLICISISTASFPRG